MSEPLIPTEVPKQPLKMTCINPCSSTATKGYHGNKSRAALRQIQGMLTSASNGIYKHGSNRSYQVLQSAAESRKLEAHRKKRNDKLRKYLVAQNQNQWGKEDEDINPADTSDTSSSGSDSADDFTTAGHPASSQDYDAWEPVWEDGFPTEDENHQEVSEELFDDDFVHEETAVVVAMVKASQVGPSHRLNLARKGSWKYVQDQGDIKAWQAEVARRKAQEQKIVTERKAIHTLRLTSHQLGKPLKRNFVEYQEAAVDRIMFSIVHEEEENEDDDDDDDDELEEGGGFRRFSI